MHSQTPLTIDVCGRRIVPFKCVSADNHQYRASRVLRADSALVSRTGYITAYRVGARWFRTSVPDSVGVTKRAKVQVCGRLHERKYEEQPAEHAPLEGEIELHNEFAQLSLVVDGVMRPFVALIGNKDYTVRFTLQAAGVPIDGPASVRFGQFSRAKKFVAPADGAARQTVTVTIDLSQYKEGEKAAFIVRAAARIEGQGWVHADPIAVVTRAQPPRERRPSKGEKRAAEALSEMVAISPVIVRPMPVRPAIVVAFEPAPQFLVPVRPIAVRPAKRANTEQN